MKAVFWFDLSAYFRGWGFYAMLLLLAALALLAGAKARFSLSDDLLANSPYQLGFLMGFLSLLSIFFSTLFAAQLVFREADARFELILFSKPLSGKQLVAGRFLALLSLTLLCMVLLMLFFCIGQASVYKPENTGNFRPLAYLQAFFWFGSINVLFTTALSASVGWLTRSKLMVYVSGLLLYMMYMISLLFSNSPFMAQSMPQTAQAQLLSAIADPFGLSAFFYETASWSIEKRNTELLCPQGMFLYNRLAVITGSVLLILWNVKRFSWQSALSRTAKKHKDDSGERKAAGVYRRVTTVYQARQNLYAFFSFVRINLSGMLKSTPFVLTALAILFYTGMELYAEIEKGIRIPQQYATSGLMVETILPNFHGLCTIIIVYYAHDLFWKSRLVNFHLVEESAALAKTRLLAQWFSLSILVVVFACLEVAEGILFQAMYAYPLIEWKVYASVFLFNVWPLVLLSALVLLIQQWTAQRYIGLILSAVSALLMATPLGKAVLSFPLLKFMQTLSIGYSDMNGFGSYQELYVWRLVFGSGITGLLFVCSLSMKHTHRWLVILLLSGISLFTGIEIMKGYHPKDELSVQEALAHYERSYRKYHGQPQPVITHVATAIDLFPDEQAYHIMGAYVLENKSDSLIQTVLLNFPEELELHRARLLSGKEIIPLKSKCQLIRLKQVLAPGQKAKLEFDMSYAWKPINSHQSFNAIVENGAFMRISRYYPQPGYLADKELTDETLRRQFKLGQQTPGKAFDAPASPNNDFIRLDMILSTKENQTAIGIGELVQQWQQAGRSYARYKPLTPVPFRFAVSSANYAVRKESYKGKRFEVWYHPAHQENVEHLIANAKLTMDYGEQNFGPYPFHTIRFAEVSAFTRGFAATAYPATVFMTENIVFHANIKADEQQDVINELAGHELSHLWWGNSQISPDERDGAAMLTETFAMYTELMLLKKMHGEAKAKERVLMHLQIYHSEKGFSQEQPLYKVQSEQTHISYSKGVVVMYVLTKLIGEGKVNLALRHFLQKHRFPNPKPMSTDFIKELYLVCDKTYHAQIDEWFKGTKEIREEDL